MEGGGAEEALICEICGVQFGPGQNPQVCPICTDERQFLPREGQKWTNLAKLKAHGHFANKWRKHEPGLYSFATEPKVGIGQRAFLIQTSHGNILWDCISLLDEATVDIIKALGGLKAIAISHPHFYATNAVWSATFGNVPVYIHESDKQWVMWEHNNVQYWNGDKLRILEGATLIRLGGHFSGGQILHWTEGASGKGVILTADILQVVMTRTEVSIMRSYPNYIPLSASHARHIACQMEPWEFERVYGSFWDAEIMSDGKSRVEYSLNRYIKWVTNEDLNV